MGMIRLLAAPIRSIVRFPLFQLAVVVAIIVFLQAAGDNTLFGKIFDLLDELVSASVQLFGQLFEVKSFTRSGLTAGLMIAYVYLVCLVIFYLLGIVIRWIVDLIGWGNVFWLRNAIARDRGIEAYRAWVPLEKIRPATISQQQWEATFAWPPNDQPPYPPLAQRIVHGALSYLVVIAGVAVVIQLFTPFPILTWLGRLTGLRVG